MDECLFCKLKEDKENLLYEDKYCYAVLEKFPGQKGETLVISKEHYNDMTSTPDGTVEHMFKIAKKIGISHKEKLAATGLKFIANAGIPGVHLHILHFHIHVIPRYEKTHGGIVNEGAGEEISDREKKKMIALLKI